MLATILVLLLAAPAVGQTFSLDAAASRITFHVTHKLHRVDGVAAAAEGRAVLAPDGRVLAMVRLPVAKLDTAESNRDANLRAVMDAGKFPFVTFKAVATTVVPAVHGKPFRLELAGELDVHGVKRAVAVPVEVELDGATVRVRGSFPVSLDGHRIERPSLLFVKVDDTCRVDLDLVLREIQP
jgi:polyisoprenoid-binding protein YceI